MADNQNENSEINDKHVDNIITIWKHLIDSQRHFNDIEIKVRNYSLTALTFFLAGMGFLEKEKLLYQVGETYISGAAILGIVGLGVLAAFHFMDLKWYHNFLVTTVKHTITVEEKWKDIMPEIGVTMAIKKSSPVKFLLWQLNSNRRINIYYFIQYITLFIISGILFFLHLKDPSYTNKISKDSIKKDIPCNSSHLKPHHYMPCSQKGMGNITNYFYNERENIIYQNGSSGDQKIIENKTGDSTSQTSTRKR